MLGKMVSYFNINFWAGAKLKEKWKGEFKLFLYFKAQS